MHQQTNKKIIFIISLFFLLTTFNNININELYKSKIKKIDVFGLSIFQNEKIKKNFQTIFEKNIFLLDKKKIINKILSNELVDSVFIHKVYPSKIIINIKKAEFLAITKKNNNTYYIGSNGKFIKTDNFNDDIPFIYGEIEINEFLYFHDKLLNSKFNYADIKNLFFFKSERWDMELKNGLLIKFPKNNIKSSLDLLHQLFEENLFKKVKIIDLRQKNQIIIND